MRFEFILKTLKSSNFLSQRYIHFTILELNDLHELVELDNSILVAIESSKDLVNQRVTVSSEQSPGRVVCQKLLKFRIENC